MQYEDRQEALVRTFGVVDAYHDDDGIFVVSPDRMGFGVMAKPIAGFDQQMGEALNALLNVPFPPGTILQFCLYASPDIEDVLLRFEMMRQYETDPTLCEMTRQRISFLRDLTQRPIGQVAGARLRQMRLVICASMKEGSADPTFEDMTRIRELQQNFEAALKTIGFRFERLSAGSYVRFMESILNHGPDAIWRRSAQSDHEAGELLCNQLLDPDTAIEVDSDEIRLGSHCHVRIQHPKRYPDYLYPGLAQYYMGDIMKGMRAMRDPVLYTVNILYPDHEAKRSALLRDFQWATRNAEGRLARFVPEYAQRATSLRIMNDAVNKGDRIVYAYISAATFSTTREQSIQAATAVQGMFRTAGFQTLPDRYALHAMFAQMMPFAAEDDARNFLASYRTMATSHVVPMLPVIGSWGGSYNPLLTLIARDGQLMPWSPYDSENNFNIVIAAQSGSGKSFLANNIVSNFLSIGGRAWIIDKGYSYKKLCEQQGGEYIEFTDDTDLCLNPFSIVKNFVDEVEILVGVLSVMAAPKEGFSEFQLPAVMRILTEQWDKHGKKLTIDALAEACLAEEDDRIKDVGHQLFAFTSKGQYGRFFNGESNVDLNNRLVVLELQQLSGREHLQRLVLLQIMYAIQQSMDSLPRDMPKIILIDEAWQLLSSGETKTFIVGWYRQLRKFGATAAICTQSINDFYASSGSEAIVENSAHKLLLGQKKESIAMVKQTGRLPMSDGEYALLESVHTVKGEYSEILFSGPAGTGVGRLVESDFNLLLFSSDARDVSAIKAFTDQGMTTVDAIKEVLRQRGKKHEGSLAA